MATKKSKTPMFTCTLSGNLDRSLLVNAMEESIAYIIRARPTSTALRECRLPAASLKPVIKDYEEYFRLRGARDIHELMIAVPDAEIQSFWASVFARSPKLSPEHQAGLASFLIEGMDEQGGDYSLPDVFDAALLVFMYAQRERLAKLLVTEREQSAVKSTVRVQAFKAEVQANATRHGLTVSFEPIKTSATPPSKKKAPSRPINLPDAPTGVK